MNHSYLNKESLGPRYWKSLDEYSNTKDFRNWIKKEFSMGAYEAYNINRRHFIKIMAASFGLAGLGFSGCQRQNEYIMPYGKQPKELVQGVSLFYATSLPNIYENIPLIVETHNARPTKIEGNPSYANYGGSTDQITQATILDLYDPDRSQFSTSREFGVFRKSKIIDLLTQVRKEFILKRGKGLAFLSQSSSSPTRNFLQSKISSIFPKSIWSEYQPVSGISTEIALMNVFNVRLRPIYKLRYAKRILAIESNFLAEGPGFLGYVRDFTANRKIKSQKTAIDINRLYSIESTYTLTGGMSDHRLRISACHILSLVYLISAELYKQVQGDQSVVKMFEDRAFNIDIDHRWVKECVVDLVAHLGESLVIAGLELSEDVQLLVCIMNSKLNAENFTLNYLKINSQKALSINHLIDSIDSKNIETLIIIGGNPVYDTPFDLNWSIKQQKVPRVIRQSCYYDETSEISNYHIASNHYLESWGDGLTWDGCYVPVQPMIMPLFNTLSDNELLNVIIGSKNVSDYSRLNLNFNRLSDQNAGSNLAFKNWLTQGVLFESYHSIYKYLINELRVIDTLRGNIPVKSSVLSKNNLEFRFTNSPQLLDGRYSNNGWLQECPDPISKICWDNIVQISPRLAKELQSESPVRIISRQSEMNKKGQMVSNINIVKKNKHQVPVLKLDINNRSLKGPLYIQPGLPNYTVVLTKGYGRIKSGRIGNNVGFNVYSIIKAKAPFYCSGGRLNITCENYFIANTQEHWSMEGRSIIKEMNVNDYLENLNLIKRIGVESHTVDQNQFFYRNNLEQFPNHESIYPNISLKGPQQWGMVIDLNACTGCNACIVACQSENNIPIVGKDQVIKGREMHWIRLDRYYSTRSINNSYIPEDPQISFIGIMCQHCELAPCESVCPVNATVHDESGLNVMAYNRCIGTRYCANNCPYKVRRFNFFDWNKRKIGHFHKGIFGSSQVSEMHKMQKNPNVTVRMRGVMEKCTYCVQRIEGARINQLSKIKDSNEIKVIDGTIKTACQQVCPSGAIIFGDKQDKLTEIYKWQQSDRNYSVLGHLNTRPRTSYLSRLRNPNSMMPDYQLMPLSCKEYESRFSNRNTNDCNSVFGKIDI